MSIEEGRREIDRLDSGLVRILALRRDAVCRLSRNKESEGIGTYNKDRERVLFSRVRGLAVEADLDPDLIGEVFASVLAYSKLDQNDLRSGRTKKLERLINQLTNKRIMEPKRFITPAEVKAIYPLTEKAGDTALEARRVIHNILDGTDKRLLLMVGPCSIDDPKAALEYAGKLKKLADDVKDDIYIVMRTYFEKPRTQLGWKGFLLDPDRDGSYDIERGHLESRKLTLDINEIGMPCFTEFLGLLTPQYFDDVIAGSAIGARTVESQPHREMASGLSMPVFFKNSTYGDEQVAIDAVLSARGEHCFVGGDSGRNYALIPTEGNLDTAIILRGGNDVPNYKAEGVSRAIKLCKDAGIKPNIIIDASHANSGKDHEKQPGVFKDIISQRVGGNSNIIGVMMESYLGAGNQKIDGTEYGVSRTDKCMDWDTTECIIKEAKSDLYRVGATA